MGLDIRKPIGLLLALLGAQLAAYGILGGVEAHRTGGNINVQWGSVLLVCGLAFLWFARKERG